MKRCLPDVNLLFALLVGSHTHHPVAWSWWEGQADDSVGLCVPVYLGVLRLLCNFRAMADRPLTPSLALAAWNQLEQDPRTFWIHPLPGRQNRVLGEKVRGREPTPNLWTDAWLAALAESGDYETVTFDRGLTHYRLPNLRILR